MEKVISSTDNKITIKGSTSITFLKAIGLNGCNILEPAVSFIINHISCNGGTESIPISFDNIIDNPKMQKNPSVVDFSNQSVIIKNKNLKTEIEFKVSENIKFNLLYEIKYFHNKLHAMKLNQDLNEIKCIKNCKENKGLSWHVNLHSVHDSMDILNELNNMYLFSGDNEEAIRFYQLLIQNNFKGQFKTSAVSSYNDYKYVYAYSSNSLT